jgi:hypothetical protein
VDKAGHQQRMFIDLLNASGVEKSRCHMFALVSAVRSISRIKKRSMPSTINEERSPFSFNGVLVNGASDCPYTEKANNKRTEAEAILLDDNVLSNIFPSVQARRSSKYVL